MFYHRWEGVNPQLSIWAIGNFLGLPKIHKPGNEMREIISAEGSPTHKLAKWLVKEFQNMPKPFPSRSVNSTQEFAKLLQASGDIQEDEVMVSFDVTALFPSVPVSYTHLRAHETRHD